MPRNSKSSKQPQAPLTFEELRLLGGFAELGKAFRSAADAEKILDRIGFPESGRPIFNSFPDAESYWREICKQVADGRTAGGLEALLASAAEDRPHNRLLKQITEAHVLPVVKQVGVSGKELPSAGADRPQIAAPARPKILVLGATPQGASPLRVTRELKVIKTATTAHNPAVPFDVVEHLSTEPRDLLRRVDEVKPTVLHFCGHIDPDFGKQSGALVLESPDGRPIQIDTALLASTLRFVNRKHKVEGIVLNACASLTVAEELVGLASAIVATKNPIADLAAIAFASGFYEGLARRDPVAEALERGKHEVHLVRYEARQNGVFGDPPKPRDEPGGPFDPDNFVILPAPGCQLDQFYIPATDSGT